MKLASPLAVLITLVLLGRIYSQEEQLPQTSQIQPDSNLSRTIVINPNLALPESSSMSTNVQTLPETCFWRRNEGAFVSSFLAALAAIFAVWLTSRVAKSSRNRREKQVHLNILAGITAELQTHRRILDYYRKKWNAFNSHARGLSKTVLRPLAFSLPDEFLKYLMQRQIEIEFIDTKDITALSEYIDRCRTLNRHIQLHLIDEPTMFVGVSDQNFNNFRKDLRKKISQHKRNSLAVFNAMLEYLEE